MGNMETDVRWGILGTGSIAGTFAQALVRTPGSQLTAVASRDLERSTAFAAQFEGVTAFGAYADLTESDVDIVYVATPHHRHVEDAELVLNARRNVLIEKPLAMSGDGVRRIEKLAADVGRIAVEGMWSYFNPLISGLIAQARSGRLGRLRGFTANCGPLGIPSGHRALDPALGGSFLWECLVYPLSLLTAIEPEFLEPDSLAAVGQMANGANRSSAVMLTTASASAQLSGAVRPDAPDGAQSHIQLDFDKAWVEIDHFYNPSAIRIGWVNGGVENRHADAEAIGFGWEIEAIADAVRGELLLPPHALLSQTRRNAMLLERIAGEMQML